MWEIPSLSEITTLFVSNICSTFVNISMNLYKNVPIVESVCIKLFSYYVSVSHKTNNVIKTIYDNSPLVQEITHKTKGIYKILHSYYYNYCIVTYIPPWICVTFTNTNKNSISNEPFSYTEDYTHIQPYSSQKITEIDYHKNQLIETIKSVIDIIKENTNYQSMIVLCIENAYYFRVVFNQPTPYNIISFSQTPCREYFITIEYKHPKQENPIDIVLGMNVFFEYNEILSCCFIHRYLEYQPIKYYFDMDYTLEIMDTDINTITLKSNQYIRLGKMNYDVVTLDE